jgi:hypothetical protein
MEIGTQIALGVAAVVVAGGGAALAIHLGNKTAAKNSLIVFVSVQAGGTYNATISKNGGKLFIVAPAANPTVTLIAGVVDDLHPLVLAAATPAHYTVNGQPEVLLPLGTTTLSVAWSAFVGGVPLPQTATINVTVA